MFLSLLIALNTVDECGFVSDAEREQIETACKHETLRALVDFDREFNRLVKRGSWISEDEWDAIAHHPYALAYIHPYTLNVAFPLDELTSKAFVQKFVRSSYHPSFVMAAWVKNKHARLFAALPKTAFKGTSSGDDYCHRLREEMAANVALPYRFVPADDFYSRAKTCLPRHDGGRLINAHAHTTARSVQTKTTDRFRVLGKDDRQQTTLLFSNTPTSKDMSTKHDLDDCDAKPSSPPAKRVATEEKFQPFRPERIIDLMVAGEPVAQSQRHQFTTSELMASFGYSRDEWIQVIRLAKRDLCKAWTDFVDNIPDTLLFDTLGQWGKDGEGARAESKGESSRQEEETADADQRPEPPASLDNATENDAASAYFYDFENLDLSEEKKQELRDAYAVIYKDIEDGIHQRDTAFLQKFATQMKHVLASVACAMMRAAFGREIREWVGHAVNKMLDEMDMTRPEHREVAAENLEGRQRIVTNEISEFIKMSLLQVMVKQIGNIPNVFFYEFARMLPMLHERMGSSSRTQDTNDDANVGSNSDDDTEEDNGTSGV